jgi:esterase/lipase
MRRVGKWLGRLLLALVAGVAVVWAFGPRETVALTRFEASLPADLDGYLAAGEARVPGIAEGVRKGIVWAGAPGARTQLALVYLHGYSATRKELSPVAETLAARLGANLYFTRLTGHGVPGAALARATPADWLRDAGEALAIGRRLGERVVVIGTSTGATLAVLAAAAGDQADGYVLVSPNFRVNSAAAVLLEQPYARRWVPWLVGAERQWEPQNEGHARYWTTSYPTVALVPMAVAVKAAREADLGAIRAPVLAIFRDADQVVNAAETRRVLARWGGAVTILNPAPVAGDDPSGHVIAGEILSPGATPAVIAAIGDWLAAF